MKYLILSIFLLGMQAGATEGTGTTLIGDPELGTFAIHVTENIEPVWHPLLYTLTVKCKGEKVSRQLKRVKVCKMRGHEYDQSSKTLVVKYTVADTSSAEGTPCTRNKVPKTYNLAEECSIEKLRGQ